MKKLTILLLALILLLASCTIHNPIENPIMQQENLKNVQNINELKSLLNINKSNIISRFIQKKISNLILYKSSMELLSAPTSSEASALNHSTTNVQVAGVDEADVVKTDGKYIYTITSDRKVIAVKTTLEGYFEEQTVFDSFAEGFYPTQLYLDESTLTVIGSSYDDAYSYVSIYMYDISKLPQIVLIKESSVRGHYVSSRKTSDALFVIANYYPGYYYLMDTDLLPLYIENGTKTFQHASDVQYFDDSDANSYLIIMSQDMKDLDESMKVESYLAGAANIYMSAENLYITYPSYKSENIYSSNNSNASVASIILDRSSTNTAIHKFSLQGAQLKYIAHSQVPGWLINQFAMDEYDGYFRIAVTAYNEDSETINEVHIFDSMLNPTGSITGLAKNERIYSVRFNQDMGYMVTFQQIDPLFVMDLSDPFNPKVDGELKIPGYSDYIHMYTDTLLIGFGMETSFQDIQGGRVVQEGLKLAMFDVEDRENPKQLFMTVLGKAGSWSELNHNHKALMFDRNRNILAFPALLTGDAYNLPSQGLVVCHINMENNSFDVLAVLSQEIIHSYNYYFDLNVKRGIYIGNILYTISNTAIYSYDYNDFTEISNFIFQ